MKTHLSPGVLTALLLSSLAGTAYAHPRLMSVSPTANAVVAPPGAVSLRFSEKLLPRFSGGDLIMAGVKGHAPMKLQTTSSVTPDGHILVIKPQAALRPGRYSVVWHVVSTDTHRVAGNYAFAVK